ncbi:hypothetical protein [Siphonobacter sp. SORGH_AS_0500]|uniref:hypothetical protein n=1 Tax=Siphonobacter sp. SORGH_AS_0500 TaxID=1864824 RepID=UPI0028674F0F|nr:hypothetical protein [Siphonobacter sp. SORGH_AS_0500]MDR6194904.1 hypothetical protein [Siphonobacter sp. SORGH_AS_0500]
MNCSEINIEAIKNELNALWDCRSRGKTIELWTPFTTLTNKFITIFITERNGDLIVTDGAYFFLGDYEVEPSADDTQLLNNILVYQRYFKVDTTYDHYKNPVYYKKTNNFNQLPTAIIELAQFIQGIVNMAFVQLDADEESEQRKLFSKDANKFFKDAFGKRAKLNHKIGNITFPVAISHVHQVSVCKYITGSNQYDFRGSLAKANLDLELIYKGIYAKQISKKVTLINDIAFGYKNDLFYEEFNLMEDKDTISVKWSEKEKLIEILQ